MGNSVAFQIDAFQNDAFQTYDVDIDVSGRGVKVTKVHFCTKQNSAFFTERVEPYVFQKRNQETTFRTRTVSTIARRRRNVALT